MGVRRYHDLIAWQLADAFKVEVYSVVERNAPSLRSWSFRDQLLESAGAVPKDIAKGFVRYSPAQFVRFLDYGLASLVEAEDWLRDAVLRKYVSAEEARAGLLLAKRTWNAALRLKHSQEEEKRRRGYRSGLPRRRPGRSRNQNPQEES